MKERTVSVRLEAVVGPYQRAMAEAGRATHKFAADVSAMEKRTDKDMRALGMKVQKLGTGMTVGLSVPLVLFAKHAADTAMTAEETANRVTVAFGTQENALHRWSEGSAHSMGLARHEAEGTAATFSNMFTEMGLGAGEAFDMSTGMVKLSADVGSFRDVDPTEMLVRMRAAVVGEYEPLRNMGIVLTDVAVRNEAVRLGLAGTREEATASALVQARYSLILQQTSKDQGDYARTANSATNASRTARAAYEDAMAELGTHLLPLVAQGAAIITAVSEAFSRLGPTGQTAILVFAGLTAVAGPAIVVTGTLIRNLQTISAVAPMAATGLRTMTVAAGGIGLALTVAATAYALFSDHQNDAAASTDRMTEAFDAFVRSGRDAAQGIVLKGLAEQATPDEKVFESYDNLLGVLQELGITTQAVGEIMTTAQDGTAKNVDATRSWASALDDSVASGKLTRDEADALSRTVFHLSNGYANASGAAADITKANGEVGESADAAAMDIDTLRKKLDELYDAALGAQEASDQFSSNLLDFVDTVRSAQAEGDGFALSLSEMSVTGLQNREMIRGLVQDLLDYAGSTGASAEQTAIMRAQLEDVLRQMGFNSEQVGGYLGVLNQIPGSIQTAVEVDTSGALREIVWYTQEQARLLREAGIETTGLSVGQPGLPSKPPTNDIDRYLRGGGPKTTATIDRARQANDGRAVADYLEGLWRERMEQVKNRFHEGQATLEEYQRSLDEQMAREVPWTDRWLALQKEKADAARFWPDAVKSYLEAVYDHRKMLEDNMYELDVISKDKYLKILEDRLKGLEKYSDAWMSVLRQIEEVEGKALDSQLRMMQQFDAGRKWERDWLALADQRALSKSWELALNATAMTPAVSAGATSIDNSSKTLNLNVPMTTSSPERVTNDTLRAGAMAMGF
jgi:hypothetical protein